MDLNSSFNSHFDNDEVLSNSKNTLTGLNKPLQQSNWNIVFLTL